MSERARRSRVERCDDCGDVVVGYRPGDACASCGEVIYE